MKSILWKLLEIQDTSLECLLMVLFTLSWCSWNYCAFLIQAELVLFCCRIPLTKGHRNQKQDFKNLVSRI